MGRRLLYDPGQRYVYNLTLLDVAGGNAPALLLRIAPDFDTWKVSKCSSGQHRHRALNRNQRGTSIMTTRFLRWIIDALRNLGDHLPAI